MKQCVICKGKGLCGRSVCPIIKRHDATIKHGTITDSIFGASPPSVFVGRKGYPSVMAGPLVPSGITGHDAAILDSPANWMGKDIQEIVDMRTSLVRSNTRMNVRDVMGMGSDSSGSIHSHNPNLNHNPNPSLLKSQELSLSKSPVDCEVWFTKPPRVELSFDNVLMPVGPSGTIRKFNLAENPAVPRKVDYLAYDTDAKASDAIFELARANIDEGHMSRLLSVGLLGQKRKLVPTRWSITAVDDTVGKQLTERVRDNVRINNILLFSGESFGNHFEILMTPRPYSFELAEIWQPKSLWAQDDDAWVGVDSEDLMGKKGYSNLSGGYYAARLGALEYLDSIGRCAAVCMIREISPAYWAPLGVWVVRQTVREVLKNRPRVFDTVDDALRDMRTRVKEPYEKWGPKLDMFEKRKYQATLGSFV